METRKQIAAEKKRCGSHNCAQAILHTYADIAGIDEELAMNIANSFGAGMGNMEGVWIDDVQPYHVVHRIASYPDAHGIFSSIMEFCFSHDTNIRIDTHRDNKIMQHNILKHSFTYCGIIYLLSGDERLAYQKMVSR